MGLDRYHGKRDFKRTPEPAGKVEPSRTDRLYVIQKHAASRLHYDLRLELGGVLKSWAIPKGPSLLPGEKMLAVHVEDHPIEYGSFEGIIPKVEYGGGTVMLWDRATWEPEADPEEGYAKGDLKIRLHGEKLRGSWVLARMKGAAGEEGKNWLLIKSVTMPQFRA
ncbi:MAG: DNA polymerase ligase N-terminal domain-containing protein [Syntrophobacteraceae bacterium]|jgi:bifunctional non-homologous end joining protein LigD